MTLIDEIQKDDLRVRFYDGIDFEMIRNHPIDGSDGFIYFFIDRWIDTVKIYQRDCKIEEIIGHNTPSINTDDINNAYIIIYQTGGQTMMLYNMIKEKVNRRIITNFPFLPVDGIRKI